MAKAVFCFPVIRRGLRSGNTVFLVFIFSFCRLVEPVYGARLDTLGHFHNSEFKGWDDLRKNFTLTDHYHGAQVSSFTASFSGRYFVQKAQRVQTYQGYINAEVLRRKLPAEMALLPLIESALYADARSPVNAVGFWQFMEATGRELGLTINDHFDGRKDILASTKAALDYLEALYSRLNNWLLVIAAYNAGEGTVRRALKKYGTHRKLDFWSLNLPAETRNHVAQLLALSRVINAPKKYHVQLPSLDIDGFLLLAPNDKTTFSLIAAETGISEKKLSQFNSASKQSLFRATYQQALIIPARDVQLQVNSEVSDCQNWCQFYSVQSGDSLSRISRSFRTQINALKHCNALSGDVIRVGQLLKVPAT